MSIAEKIQTAVKVAVESFANPTKTTEVQRSDPSESDSPPPAPTTDQSENQDDSDRN